MMGAVGFITVISIKAIDSIDELSPIWKIVSALENFHLKRFLQFDHHELWDLSLLTVRRWCQAAMQSKSEYGKIDEPKI